MSENELKDYLRYWDVEFIAKYMRGRKLSAATFYLLHSPGLELPSNFWQRNVRQAVTFLWDNIRTLKNVDAFRTPECLSYFTELLNDYISTFGAKEVFGFRYQNWQYVDCQTMVDQYWAYTNVRGELENGH